MGNSCNREHEEEIGEDTGCFPFTKSFGKYLLEISVWEECVPFAPQGPFEGAEGHLGA